MKILRDVVVGVLAGLLVGLLAVPGARARSPATAGDAQDAGWTGERLPDPARTAPTQVARFFAALGPARQASLAARYPRIVGNLDGAPPPLRLAANRGFLVYDPSGDGRVAQVFGDLATADRIAVVVPGVDNRLANFATGHGGVLKRAPAWQAEQLYGEAVALDPRARVAVVAWLGYDPPEGIGADAFREERAAAGVDPLRRFVEGVVAYRPGAAVTVIGHSYGSIVVGRAAATLPRQVGDIVSVASPGMGVDRAGDLHTRARIWAGAARADWIHRVPGVRLLGFGHGTLPSGHDFGARPLSTEAVTGHDGYFVPGTGSLHGMASIVLGLQ
jgi:hypothetical protein